MMNGWVTGRLGSMPPFANGMLMNFKSRWVTETSTPNKRVDCYLRGLTIWTVWRHSSGLRKWGIHRVGSNNGCVDFKQQGDLGAGEAEVSTKRKQTACFIPCWMLDNSQPFLPGCFLNYFYLFVDWSRISPHPQVGLQHMIVLPLSPDRDYSASPKGDYNPWQGL